MDTVLFLFGLHINTPAGARYMPINSLRVDLLFEISLMGKFVKIKPSFNTGNFISTRMTTDIEVCLEDLFVRTWFTSLRPKIKLLTVIHEVECLLHVWVWIYRGIYDYIISTHLFHYSFLHSLTALSGYLQSWTGLVALSHCHFAVIHLHVIHCSSMLFDLVVSENKLSLTCITFTDTLNRLHFILLFMFTSFCTISCFSPSSHCC
jgi:hypothetical protein